MYIHVDDDASDIEGFEFTNQDGRPERVKFCGVVDDVVVIEEARSNDEYRVYVNDIPKMIKALQSAYNHKKQA